MRLLHRLIFIFQVLPILIRDTPITIVLEFQLKVVLTIVVVLTSEIVVVTTVQLLLQLLQVGLPAE